MRIRFTIDSDWRRNTEYEIQTQIFAWPGCFDTKREVDEAFN